MYKEGKKPIEIRCKIKRSINLVYKDISENIKHPKNYGKEKTTIVIIIILTRK